MDIEELLVFVKVAQAGSFSRAAKQLTMPVSTVSRKVASLEEHLGATLLHRTTRSLKVTELGLAYLEHGKTIAAEIERVESLGPSLQSIPQGLLKITAPTDLGNQFLGGIVSEFLELHPQVKTEILLSGRLVDLVSEGYDIAIRIGELGDSTLMARKLGMVGLQLYASPDFLRKNGEPKACKDLSKFDCIRFTEAEDPDVWSLQVQRGRGRAKDELKVPISGRIAADNMALIRDFALAGQGIALVPYFLCADDVRAGKLKVILKDWVSDADPIHAVFPRQRFVQPKVRAFIDHLVQAFSKVRWTWNGP